MGLLNNKKLVVMGVANKWSIAWGIAKKFHEENAELIFTYFGDRSKKSLEKLIQDEGIEAYDLISCDVSSDEDLDQAFETIKKNHGEINGLVHCIAHADKDELRGCYYNTSRAGFAMAQDISAYSLVAATQRAVKLMPNGGSIITLSYLGSERAIKNYNVMGVAKASLEASVRYLAADVGGDNIRVNAISAGPVKTLAAKGVGEFEKIAERYSEASPMKRMATVEEIAGAAAFLASDLGSGVTGEVLHVDCGYNMVGV
ncbi:MAG: enoyl-ACP reductase [Clostridia bacterium]|nr:enoyl-ACP reductase [Clostridia bacterium]